MGVFGFVAIAYMAENFVAERFHPSVHAAAILGQAQRTVFPTSALKTGGSKSHLRCLHLRSAGLAPKAHWFRRLPALTRSRPSTWSNFPNGLESTGVPDGAALAPVSAHGGFLFREGTGVSDLNAVNHARAFNPAFYRDRALLLLALASGPVAFSAFALLDQLLHPLPALVAKFGVAFRAQLFLADLAAYLAGFLHGHQALHARSPAALRSGLFLRHVLSFPFLSPLLQNRG